MTVTPYFFVCHYHPPCLFFQVFPEKDYLTGDVLLMEYDPIIIAMLTDLLTFEHVNMLWVSKKFSSECDQKEKWFGINYSVHGMAAVK